MNKGNTLAGLGGVTFAVLAFLALFVADPPGGSYKASDVANYVAKGHRPEVILSLYLMLLAVLGLIALLIGMRDLIAKAGESIAGRLFWVCGLIAATGFAIGWCLLSTVSLSRAVGGGPPIDPTVAYTFLQAGFAVVFVIGGTLLALSMISLAIASAAIMPAAARLLTAACGVIGLFSLAFFPFFILLLWALGIGLWTLALRRAPSTRVVAAQTS